MLVVVVISLIVVGTGVVEVVVAVVVGIGVVVDVSGTTVVAVFSKNSSLSGATVVKIGAKTLCG